MWVAVTPLYFDGDLKFLGGGWWWRWGAEFLIRKCFLMCPSCNYPWEKLCVCPCSVDTPQSSCECSNMEHLLVEAEEDFLWCHQSFCGEHRVAGAFHNTRADWCRESLICVRKSPCLPVLTGKKGLLRREPYTLLLHFEEVGDVQSYQVYCLLCVNGSVHPCVIGWYSIGHPWFTPHTFLTPESQHTGYPKLQHESGSHTAAIKPIHQWALTVGICFSCVPCLGPFLTCVSAELLLDLWGQGNWYTSLERF